MENHFHYATVSDALTDLRRRGFNIDFNLAANCLKCSHGDLHPEDFDIVDVYRYEGDSDPGDEATVYAIESKSGLKGVLVTGYGASSDIESTALLTKLNTRVQ